MFGVGKSYPSVKPESCCDHQAPNVTRCQGGEEGHPYRRIGASVGTAWSLNGRWDRRQLVGRDSYPSVRTTKDVSHDARHEIP